MNQKIHAYLMLFLVAVIWGATFPIIHNSVKTVDPLVFVWIRFSMAGLFLLPFMWRHFRFRDNASFKFGLILGLINGCTFVLQTLALERVDSSRVAFLTATYIILVPLMLPMFGFRKPKLSEGIAAVICLIGVYIITGARINGFVLGDLFVLTSAISIALGLIVVEYANKHKTNRSLFNFYQIIFTTILPMGGMFSQHINIPSSISFWASVSYCAIFATVVAFLMQLKYQPVTGASKAALIFSLESVFAGVFSWIAGEEISRSVIIGGSIILFSTVLVDIIHIIKPLHDGNAIKQV